MARARAAASGSPVKQWNTPASGPRACLGDEPQGVGFGLAGVNHDRQLAAPAPAELRPEHRVLHVPGREVVVVVEADLADRPHRRRGVEPLGHCLCRRRPGRRRRRAPGADARRRRTALRPGLRAPSAARPISASSSAARITSARDDPAAVRARPRRRRSATNSSPARWQWLSIMARAGAELELEQTRITMPKFVRCVGEGSDPRLRIPSISPLTPHSANAGAGRRRLGVHEHRRAAVGAGGQDHAVGLECPSSCAARGWRR